MNNININTKMHTYSKYQILTEETPNIDEIHHMLLQVGKNIPIDTKIIPIIKEGSFTGIWTVKTDDILVDIKLFKGTTSSVDYMLFDGDIDLTNGDAGKALVVLESTKTNDKQSRNTAVMQRISKFIVFKKMYPNSNAKLIMFYLESKWKDNLTDTAMFGFKMMTLLGIELYSVVNKKIIDLKLKYNITPFRTDDELINFKNNIKVKKGNVSVRITKENNVYKITGKLDKGDENSPYYGKLSHDPNKGMLGAIMNCIEKLNPGSKKILTTHGLNEDSLKKCKNNKFFILLYDINFEFHDITFTNTIKLPDKYFKIESEMTEKLATILCDEISSYNTIFSNHGGCALTNIKGVDRCVDVGRKMPRPDIVFENSKEKEIVIIEGKIEKELKKGIKQLSDEHLKDFITILKKLYPLHNIKKGLCITIRDVNDIKKYDTLEYPILFALDNNGKFINLL